MIASVRSYLAEPAVPDPPRRNWRDWALVGAASISATLEALLRTDTDWTAPPAGWRVAAVLVFVASVPPALLMRRTRPVAAVVVGFIPNLLFGAVIAAVEGVFGGLLSTAVVLVVPYAVYRWGSGRDGAVTAGVLVTAGVVGNLTDPSHATSDWVGGFVVLSIPVLLGLAVRYAATARERTVAEIKARQREDLARELHDSVAHHVSAIAIQARAGRAVGPADPARALEILGVIEQAASRTLAEMRSIVVALRDGDGAELSPRRGVADLHALVDDAPPSLPVTVVVDESLGEVAPAIGTTIYRIARESLTNAARHARNATTVRIVVERDGDLIRLTVSDDGDGGTGAPPDTGGQGLRGMAERALLVGGSVQAGPAPGRGWVVSAELPSTADAVAGRRS